MESYLPQDLSSAAKQIVSSFPRNINQATTYGSLPRRSIALDSATVGTRTPAARGRDFIKMFADNKSAVKNPAEAEGGIDISHIEQLVEPGQVRTIAEYVYSLAKDEVALPMADLVEKLEKVQQTEGLDGLECGKQLLGDLVEARRYEVAAAMNRLRGLKVR